MRVLKYFSLFSGVGGFELAIHNVIPQAECIGFSEIDKFAITSYLKNFPDHEFNNYGDISLIDFSKVPDFDLLVGGSPCTDLSIAKGNREGLAGSRSGLFFRYVELLALKKPKYFILENVASMSKEAREEMTATLQSVSKDQIHVVEICSDQFTPQKRRRLYWTNFKVEAPPAEMIGERWPDLVAWSRSTRYPEGREKYVEERELRDGRGQYINNRRRMRIFFIKKLYRFLGRTYPLDSGRMRTPSRFSRRLDNRIERPKI